MALLFQFDSQQPIKFCLVDCPKGPETKALISNHGGRTTDLPFNADFIVTRRGNSIADAVALRDRFLDVRWIVESINTGQMIPLYDFKIQTNGNRFDAFRGVARDLVEVMEQLIAGRGNQLYVYLHRWNPHKTSVEWQATHTEFESNINLLIAERQKKVADLEAQVQAQILKLQAQLTRNVDGYTLQLYLKNLHADANSRESVVPQSIVDDVTMDNRESEDNIDYPQEEDELDDEPEDMPAGFDDALAALGRARRGRGEAVTLEDKREMIAFARRFRPRNPSLAEWEIFANQYNRGKLRSLNAWSQQWVNMKKHLYGETEIDLPYDPEA